MADPRSTLTAKLADIDAQLASMSAPPTDSANISFGKRVGDGTQLAVDRLSQVAVHDKLRVTRADVARALEKIEEGSYGACDVCRKPIAPARLEALPWAVLCIADASQAR